MMMLDEDIAVACMCARRIVATTIALVPTRSA